jgi:hypothetical protein
VTSVNKNEGMSEPKDQRRKDNGKTNKGHISGLKKKREKHNWKCGIDK